MDERTFHEVKPEDMERIACGACGAARAVFCEHAPNARGVSFWYYCAACWTSKGTDGTSALERTHVVIAPPRPAVTWKATMYAAEVGPWRLSCAWTSAGSWIWHVVDTRRSDRDGWVHVGRGEEATESAAMAAAHAVVMDRP